MLSGQDLGASDHAEIDESAMKLVALIQVSTRVIASKSAARSSTSVITPNV
jgi:hypothetical protein